MKNKLMKKMSLPTDYALQNAYFIFIIVCLLRPPFEIFMLGREVLESIFGTLLFATVLAIATYLFDKTPRWKK